MKYNRNQIIRFSILIHATIVTLFILSILVSHWNSSEKIVDGEIVWNNLYTYMIDAIFIIVAMGHSIFIIALLSAASVYRNKFVIVRNVAFGYSVLSIYGVSAFIFISAYR